MTLAPVEPEPAATSLADKAYPALRSDDLTGHHVLGFEQAIRAAI